MPSAVAAVDGRPTTARAANGSEGPDGPVLSVIVVTHDEAERIADCLDSVFAACRDVTPFEVVLVDSNSNDETVEIAREYDVTIYRIPDDDLTTPGAGRYVGTRRARGDYLLFVDGDVRLTDTGWLPSALESVRSASGLAGVDGHLNESRHSEERAVDYLHGVALYDRGALDEVGTYHPFLAAWEDVDLGFQLGLAGYELRRLPSVVGEHPYSSSPLAQLRRWRLGYYRAGGQVLRKALDDPPLLRCWLWKFRERLVASAWILLGVALAVSPPLLAVWLVTSLVGLGLLSHRIGLEAGIQRCVTYVMFPAGVIFGFEVIRSPEAFPLDRVRTVQVGSVVRGHQTVGEMRTD